VNGLLADGLVNQNGVLMDHDLLYLRKYYRTHNKNEKKYSILLRESTEKENKIK